MRRRFGGRGRGRSQGPGRRAPIDAERWLARIVEEGVVAASRLEPLAGDEIPDHLVAVGEGEAQDGTRLAVGFAPRSGGDAVLGALAAAWSLGQRPGEAVPEEDEAGPEATVPPSPEASPSPEGGAAAAGFDGEVIAVAPQWSTAARRRLGLLGDLPFRFRALAASGLGEADVSVEPEPVGEPVCLPPAQVAGHLARTEDRALFERAAAALEGLAGKHGGAVRGVGRALELVLLARRVAELRADEGGVLLNTLQPTRASVRLSAGELAGALDRLEGNLRRRLSDRRVAEGEEGLRSRALPLLADALALRAWVAWPVGGSDHESLDLAGVDAEGQVHLAAVRGHLGLAELGPILDAVAWIHPALPTLLGHAGPPLRLDGARLVLAAKTVDPVVTGVLPLLGLAYGLVELSERRGGEVALSLLESGEAPARRRPRRGRRNAPRREEAEVPAEEEPEAEAAGGDESAAAEESEGSGRGRRRRRGGRRRGRAAARSEEDGDREAAGSDEAREGSGSEASGGMEEFSLFDLDDDGEGESGPRRRSRRRRPRRGGRSDRGEGSDDRDEAAPEARKRRRGSGEAPAAVAAAVVDDDDDEPEDLEEMVTDLPELELEDEAPRYDDDDEPDTEHDQVALERERRRRARMAKSAEVVEKAVEQEKPKPRRRSAFVAHADRDSILSALVLARDVRLLEGFWVYPQEELMTFFRSVATDLKEGTPIYVIGFSPRPARDVMQAVSLYGDRVRWFDHHGWPPEDELALRQTIGEDNVVWQPETGSSLPAVLSTCSRRSRFSDKLVDLATARFTLHDYARWGRLWWWRLGEMAANPGDRRQDLEALMAGRPSELAKESARRETPPPPAEVDYVAGRDFRLVHFGDVALVVVEAPSELDLHVCTRVARERYGALLSLGIQEGSERVVLAGEELGGKRSLDFGSMVEHLCSKLDGVEPLADTDHVARFRVRGLREAPERLEAVIAEIAMGRSILEG